MILPNKDNYWNIFRKTNGALSCSESLFIMQAAALAPKGRYIECGVAYGKSAMSALVSLQEFTGEQDEITFHLVDPLLIDTDLCKQIYNDICEATGWKNMSYAFEYEYSIDVLPRYNKYSYAMLDSGDHDEIVIQEIDIIKDRMVSGGVIVLHDLDSQFVKVREGYDYLLSTGDYEEIKPNWEDINMYVKDNNLEEGNTSWHHPEIPFPNFVGAVKRK